MTEEESIDIEDLNEKMQTFSQDLLELNALKNKNLRQFKERLSQFVEKRTSVMLTLNKLARQLDKNDTASYQLTEGHIKALEAHEARAKTLCGNIQQEKGADTRILQYFEDQIKKYEF